MSAHANDLQTDFLNALVSEQKVVWVFLMNGIKLIGQLKSFDQYVLALESPTGIQAVFKSAVSTVCEPHAIEKSRPREGRPATSHERHSLGGYQR
jgi:host factor-I protein